MPPFLRYHLFFLQSFEELQAVLSEVELIINNAPLTYVYPNTQSFVVIYLADNYYILLTQHQL